MSKSAYNLSRAICFAGFGPVEQLIVEQIREENHRQRPQDGAGAIPVHLNLSALAEATGTPPPRFYEARRRLQRCGVLLVVNDGVVINPNVTEWLKSNSDAPRLTARQVGFCQGDGQTSLHYSASPDRMTRKETPKRDTVQRTTDGTDANANSTPERITQPTNVDAGDTLDRTTDQRLGMPEIRQTVSPSRTGARAEDLIFSGELRKELASSPTRAHAREATPGGEPRAASLLVPSGQNSDSPGGDDLIPLVAGPGKDSERALKLEAAAQAFGNDNAGNSYAVWGREQCQYMPAKWVWGLLTYKVNERSRPSIFVLNKIAADWRMAGKPEIELTPKKRPPTEAECVAANTGPALPVVTVTAADRERYFAYKNQARRLA